MGVIQSAINQLLGSSTIIAAGAKHFQQQKLGAEAQASEAAEKGTVLVSERNLRHAIESGASPEEIKQKEKIVEGAKDVQTAGDIQRSLKLAKAEKGGLIEGRKQLKGLTKIKEESRNIYKQAIDQYMTDEATRQENALLKVAQKSESQQKQKRNFKEYLKQQPISGGGTVGQLSDKAINSIAKQYTPAQRKKLMDTMDKEKMNKDGK